MVELGMSLYCFFNRLDSNDNTRKIVFIHNLSFEFQALWSVLRIKSVMSRKSRKLLTCQLRRITTLSLDAL